MKHILLDTGLGKGPEEYGNMGDISMLQVAIDRLHHLFPETSLEVLTDSADNLARVCPMAKPVDNRGRALWFADGVMLGRVAGLAPRWFSGLLVWLKRTIRSQWPGLLEAILVRRLLRQNRPADSRAVTAFSLALDRADLFLICGAGGFYDGCQTWNLEILDFVETAFQRNKPVAMLGQGFGPISDPIVLNRAARILPRVNFITLRGGRGSFAILRSLGVDESKLETTGDEALELAYSSRTGENGNGLGINIRYLASAGTDDNDVQSIKLVMHEFARRQNVPLIPLPIAIHFGTRDDLAIKQLLIGFDDQSDGGETLDSPLKVIQQVALCRVVVTGAYHAAVFALAQGIPVVALAKSAYFVNKMLGLQDQFGGGCQTVILNEPDLPRRLNSAMETAWTSADAIREQLQTVALRQIELSRRSYARIQDLAGGATESVRR